MDRRAGGVALACLHGGTITRPQWMTFPGWHHEKLRRAVHALVAQGVAVEERPGGLALSRGAGAHPRDGHRIGAIGQLRRSVSSVRHAIHAPIRN